MVPAVFAGVMIGLFGMQYVSSTTGLSTVLWAATMVAIIVRLAISDSENKRLLEQVRTDPLTGLASRGALQVDLEGICAKATEEEPISILLFDLNGFKGYNDTFGHPAGDELLAELGGRLRRGRRRTAPPTGSAATSSASSSPATARRLDRSRARRRSR